MTQVDLALQDEYEGQQYGIATVLSFVLHLGHPLSNWAVPICTFTVETPTAAKRPWNLVMKIGSQTDKLGFSSALWTNGDLPNQNSPIQDSTDAKCMCIGCPESNCVTHKFSKSYDSAKALFSAGYIRDETVKRDEILKAFGVARGSYQDFPMLRPGLHIKCHDNNWARWGFCFNCAQAVRIPTAMMRMPLSV